MPSWGLCVADCQGSAGAASAQQRTCEPLLPGLVPSRCLLQSPGTGPPASNPEHLHYGAMDSLPASWLDSTMASCLENVVAGGCPWPGKAAYIRVCSFSPCTGLPCHCFAVRWGSGCLSAVPAEKLGLQRLGHFHSNPLPLRMPSSACVRMTHLAFVLHQSLSLIKRHWLKTSQAHFQPLPR